MTEIYHKSKRADDFPSMADIIPPMEGEKYKITHFEVNKEEAKKQRMYSLFSFSAREYYDFEAGKYVRLSRKGGNGHAAIVMSDTPMEKRTNWGYLWQANGDVLQGGLGFGMTLYGICKKEEVKKVTVIELEQEIIDMVWPHMMRHDFIRDKAEVICADVLEWKPPKNKKWDTIYFDIWDEITEDNWESMKKLRRRYGQKVNRKENPKAWMDCWRSEDCRPKKDERWW